LLFLLGLPLSQQINLGDPEFNIDGLVSKWSCFIKSSNGGLAHLNSFIEHVGVIKSAFSLDFHLDGNDVTMLRE